MIEQMEGQMSIFDLDIWSGKMCPEHSAVTKERTSERSLKKRQKWQKGMPAFLDLRGGQSGLQQDVSWEMGGALLGEYTMHSFGECPSEERGSLLSQILEVAPHPKYSLSAKACLGILRRAEKRGKILPQMLDMALRNQAGLSVFKNEQESQEGASVVYGISAYDSNSMKSSNPHSGIYEAETARTLDLNGGSPACNQGGMAVVYDASRRHNYEPFGEVCETVQAHYGTGGGNVPIVLEGNGSRPSHQGDGYKESETMYTLNSTEHHAVCQPTVIEMTNTKNTIVEDGISPTLTARMGTGGNQVNAVLSAEPTIVSHGGFMTNPDNSGKAHTLQATDYKDPQVVAYGIDRAAYNQGINAQYDFSIEREKIATQVAKGPGAVWSSVWRWIVRRLTPMECERLQGFPDHWTDIGEWYDSKGKKHKDADSPRYKALGNSIALPFWEWMAERMVRLLKVEEPTMASLFDGIGGFPLSFTRAGCKPIWASEIEEFPIAVTKLRFKEEYKNG